MLPLLCRRCTSPCTLAFQRFHLLHGRTVGFANRQHLTAPLFHAICLTWTHSKHSGFAGRTAFLPQKFCNLLIDRVRKIYIWVTAEKVGCFFDGALSTDICCLGVGFSAALFCAWARSIPCALCLIEKTASFGEEHQYDLPGNYPLLSLLIKQRFYYYDLFVVGDRWQRRSLLCWTRCSPGHGKSPWTVNIFSSQSALQALLLGTGPVPILSL